MQRVHRPGAERETERARAAPRSGAVALARTPMTLRPLPGNRATATLIEAQRAGAAPEGRLVSLAAPPARGTPLLQRAAHRPEVGSQIRYQGHIWTVQASNIHSPQITIWRPPNHMAPPLAWAPANYTIIRQNTAQDHDLRENDPGAAGGPVDRHAGLGSFDRSARIRQRFAEAKRQALQMIKDQVRQSINQQSQASLAAIELEHFTATRSGPTLVGAGKPTEAAEWELTWIERGDNNAIRRTWRLVIDSDNPLPTSSQEPHVGWTVSAAAGSQPAVGNTFGHVWLDHVPVMRA